MARKQRTNRWIKRRGVRHLAELEFGAPIGIAVVVSQRHSDPLRALDLAEYL